LAAVQRRSDPGPERNVRAGHLPSPRAGPRGWPRTAGPPRYGVEGAGPVAPGPHAGGRSLRPLLGTGLRWRGKHLDRSRRRSFDRTPRLWYAALGGAFIAEHSRAQTVRTLARQASFFGNRGPRRGDAMSAPAR